MVGTPSVQHSPKLGGPEGDLRGKLLGHIQAPWEPMGPQELPIKDQGNPSWVHPALLLAVQRATRRHRRRRYRRLPIWDYLRVLGSQLGRKGP